MEPTPIEVSCQDVKRRLDAGEELTLVDCREPSEHEIVRIEGARLIPMADIPSKATELTTSGGSVVIHCHHGMRSLQTAEWLRANGVPNAASMAGGIDAWAIEIDPSLPRY